VLDVALRGVPPDWIDGEEYELDRVMTELLKRRPRVPELIEDCRKGRNNPFPDWR
jgi:hypothetical protein